MQRFQTLLELLSVKTNVAQQFKIMVAEDMPEEDRPVKNGDHSAASKKNKETGASKAILRYDQ
jgi:hypothetical protein